jgi:hypothetical protein
MKTSPHGLFWGACFLLSDVCIGLPETGKTFPDQWIDVLTPGRVAEYLIRFGDSRKQGILDLSKFRLKGFPMEITTCEYLTTLDLSGNSIGKLPYDVCTLSNLVCLRLEGCRLVGRLTQVTTQYISACAALELGYRH